MQVFWVVFVKCVVVCMIESSPPHLKVGLLYSSARILVVLQFVPSTWLVRLCRDCLTNLVLLLIKRLLVVRRLSYIYSRASILARQAPLNLVWGVTWNLRFHQSHSLNLGLFCFQGFCFVFAVVLFDACTLLRVVTFITWNWLHFLVSLRQNRI